MIDIIRRKRSVRKFSSTPMSQEIIAALKETAIRTPSSRSRRPFEFVFVQSKDTLITLAKAKPHGAAFIADAALAVVVLGAPDESDAWIEDCSIASTLLQYTADSYGVGNCWVQIRMRMHDDARSASDYVKDCLHIPPNYEVESIIALGYPDEDTPPHSIDDFSYDKIHDEKF